METRHLSVVTAADNETGDAQEERIRTWSEEKKRSLRIVVMVALAYAMSPMDATLKSLISQVARVCARVPLSACLSLPAWWSRCA